MRRSVTSPLFPYATLFRSQWRAASSGLPGMDALAKSVTTSGEPPKSLQRTRGLDPLALDPSVSRAASCALVACLRSEEHTSELQSPCNIVCRRLLEQEAGD